LSIVLEIDENQLPKSWRIATIGAVSLRPAEYGSVSSALPWSPELPRYVRITDIESDGSLSRRTMAGIDWDSAQQYLLSKGDLCFARSGATVGKTYLYNPNDGVCAFAGYVIRFAIDPQQALPEYVSMWTRSEIYQRWVSNTIRQGAQPNINAQEYSSHFFPLPPLVEQQEIVDILRAADQQIRSIERTIAKWNEAKKGLLQRFITDDFHREGYIELRSCLIEIEAGRSPDLPDRPAGPGDWGVLKVSAVRSGGFDAVENKAVTISSMVNPRHEVRDGDLLITRANTPPLVGAACYVEQPPSRLLLSDKTLRLVVDRRKLNARFASYVLASPGVRRQIEVSGTGTSGSMKNISQNDILTLRFHLPSIETQERIVESVESINSLIAQYRAEKTKLWQTRHGLMNDLLTGRRRAIRATRAVTALR
jgi:type I restriction enzyme S subunit